MADDVEELRRRLRQLAGRRERVEAQRTELAADIRATVQEAQEHIPMAEIARLLGIDRSTLYRTYVE